jgi:hypothetical protein
MFTIQLGHPKIETGPFPTLEKVKDAFFYLFRLQEESVYLFWYAIPLQFRYRGDLYHNFNTILAMTWLIQRNLHGATKVNLTNALLSVQWEIHWDERNLTIAATFSALDELYAPYAHALNHWSEIMISKQAFLNEWKSLLHQIIVAFQSAQVEIEDGTERRKWEMLQRVERQIPCYGQLYRRSA